ncbi:aminopeptidase M1-A-like [Camponotus floridanus]|nr:aminopeptidase M1-A-like [Camponotus floridanus]
MPIREKSEDNKNGMIWTHFDTTPIMSTYLVAFVVVDYVRVPTEDETINIWCRSKVVPHTKFAQEVVQKSKRLLTEYTNSTSEVPKWIFETSFAYNENFNTISAKLDVAEIIVHEMAHQWLSNVVTPSWWSHVWLSEGLTTFFEEYILNQQTILQKDIHMNMSSIILEVNRPNEIESLFDTNYGKGTIK